MRLRTGQGIEPLLNDSLAGVGSGWFRGAPSRHQQSAAPACLGTFFITALPSGCLRTPQESGTWLSILQGVMEATNSSYDTQSQGLGLQGGGRGAPRC